jgi:3-keto-5-aminohexanoate cleavage enzyme
MVDELYDEMADRGIKPELEAFNDGHVNELHGLLRRRDLAEPYHTTLIFGGGTLTPARPRNLLNSVDNLPDGATFNTLGFGQHQLPFATLGMLLGGHVRVGLEDNVHYDRGELARSNAQLVERVAEIVRTLGREPATPAQARERLGLD